MATITLACNFLNEKENIRAVANNVQDIIDDFIVVDTGSTDGTREIARKLGARVYVMPIDIGYGMVRTIMLHLCFTDWMLILDGDERMTKEHVFLLKELADKHVNDMDVIALPRHNYRAWDMSVVENPDLSKYADWQYRFVRVKKEIHWVRKVHEQIRGVNNILQETTNPIIRHFGFMKTKERQQMIVDMCNRLWKSDEENRETYVLENQLGCASGEKYWREAPKFHEQQNKKKKTAAKSGSDGDLINYNDI